MACGKIPLNNTKQISIINTTIFVIALSKSLSSSAKPNPLEHPTSFLRLGIGQKYILFARSEAKIDLRGVFAEPCQA